MDKVPWACIHGHRTHLVGGMFKIFMYYLSSALGLEITKRNNTSSKTRFLALETQKSLLTYDLQKNDHFLPSFLHPRLYVAQTEKNNNTHIRDFENSSRRVSTLALFQGIWSAATKNGVLGACQTKKLKPQSKGNGVPPLARVWGQMVCRQPSFN